MTEPDDRPGTAARPRHLPEWPLPAAAPYLPGRGPRPADDPNAPAPDASALPDGWRGCAAYLYGVDLFNHGFYWEAHEAWEGLWHGCGRRGATADLLKALIALAAAGLKLRTGPPRGAAAHARRAARLLRAVAAERDTFMGLDSAALATRADTIARHPAAERDGPAVFAWLLHPR